MKNSRLFLTSLTACAALPVSGLLAQTAAAPASTPSVSAPAATARTTDADEDEGGNAKVRAAYMALTPEERKKVRAARQAAMKDPAVAAARENRATDRRGFRDAMRAAMIKADPSVAPLIDKLQAAAREKKAERKGL